MERDDKLLIKKTKYVLKNESKFSLKYISRIRST